MLKLITTLPKQKALEFVKTGRISDLNTMPQINNLLIGAIKECIHKTVGYDSLPIACLSKADGVDGALSDIGSGVTEYLPISTDTVLFELHMPEDMVVSIGFEELLSASSDLNNCTDQWEIELVLEEFKSKLHKGLISNDNVISFVPFIDLKRCKFFSMLSQNWDMQNMNIPGLKEIKLNNISLF